MVRCPGMFKNFQELEENLSLPELEAILSTARELEHDSQRFAASLKGIKLDANDNGESQEEAFERVQRRAKARLSGMSEEQFELSEAGINFVEE